VQPICDVRKGIDYLGEHFTRDFRFCQVNRAKVNRAKVSLAHDMSGGI